MRELYVEGVATHGGPEPCVGDPRGRSEALDRGTHRPAIEPRNGVNRGADVVMTGGRQHRWWRYARAIRGPREVGEPVHVRNLHAREPGDPTIALPPGTVRAARGRLRPHARDVRSWEVGLPHSVACQRDGTTALPRPRDHLGVVVMVIVSPRWVNQDTPVEVVLVGRLGRWRRR